ncbi:MAG TPA: DUF5668 domain-containing protein [Thermoanaerobaculia bacterium]|nr:DUF5668 domain-containing protein [Thermoanaerobaculia bacterium]
MNNFTRLIDIDSLFWGLALAAVGLLFLLDRIEALSLGTVLRTYWPLFILFLGRRTE